MATIQCVSGATGNFDFVIDGVTYGCVTDSPPIVLVDSGVMTRDDFYDLWPALMLVLVLGFCGWAVRKMLM